MNFLRNLLRKPQRHYRARVGEYVDTCACGFHSVWDRDLRLHFREQEGVGK